MGKGVDRPRRKLRRSLRLHGVVQKSSKRSKSTRRARAKGSCFPALVSECTCVTEVIDGRSQMRAHTRTHARTHAGPPTGSATPHYSDTLKAFNPVDAANGHAVSSECY